MTKNQARFEHIANALVGFSGLLYAYFRYFCASSDPFSAAPHPLETWMQAAHIVVAPILVFAAGLIWKDHVWNKIKKSRSPRRFTGITLAVMLLPMIVSGYLVQTTVDDGWRKTWAISHWVTSGLWLGAYLGHLLTPRLLRTGRIRPI